MRLILAAKGKTLKISDTMKLLIERRMRFALGRFEEHVKTVRVTLEDVNGPKGGLDKRCMLRVEARDVEPIMIEERDSRFAAAITRAAERAHRAMTKEVGKLVNQRIDRTAVRAAKRRSRAGE